MKKKIYLCPNCRRGLTFSNNPEYTFQCLDCEEDFHDFEVDVVEQSKVEGIKDYTELAEAAMKVMEITNSTLKANDKLIQIRGESIIEQIAEYINETLRPIIDSGLHNENGFKTHLAIYNGRLRLEFPYGTGNEYVAVFRLTSTSYQSECDCVYFYANHECKFNHVGEINLREIVEKWHGFKDTMNRMIPYAIERCNEENQKKIERKQEMSEVLNSFRL